MDSENLDSKRSSASALWRRKQGIPTRAQRAEDQRYLTRLEEKSLLATIRNVLLVEGSIRGKQVRKLAGEIRRRRAPNIHDNPVTQSPADPGPNWAAEFLKANRQGLNIRSVPGGPWQTIVGDFAATPSDVEQLCSECALIKWQINAELIRPSNGFRKLHTFQRSSDDNRRTQCKLCSFVEDCAWNWDWPAADRFSLRMYNVGHIFGPTVSGSKALISISIDNSSSKKQHQGWIVPTLLGSDASLETGGAWGQLRTAPDLERIREWLKCCDEHHTSGCRMPKLDVTPFFRLIDCATRSIVEAPDQAEYTALSYCWEPSPNTQRNESTELPSTAPLVIEDAIKVTRALGISYLWVDRYCNSRTDPNILHVQLQNMHKVYRSAYVTIIAGCGMDPTFGLPGVSTRARKPQVSIQTHGYYLYCIPDIKQEIHSSRWSTRGWTYQEALLSKRRLVFTETQTYFQCWNMHCCESTPLDLGQAHTKNFARFKETINTFRVFPQEGIGRTSNEVEQRIQEYHGRSLTNDTDALNAFLGISQAFQELEDPVYSFWGLPIGDKRSITRTCHNASEPSEFDELDYSLLPSLAWSAESCDGPSAYLLTKRSMFPSWTWAAWKCLPLFSRKSVTETLYSPCISFKTRQGQSVQGEKFIRALGSSISSVVFEPCIYLDGWVTDVRLVQDASNGKSIGFQVIWPIPTHRVAIVANISTATTLQTQVLTDTFPVILLGSESLGDNDSSAPPDSLKDVHAMIIQAGPGRSHTRLGLVSWSRLGVPSLHDGGSVLRLKELVEARRIVPQCQCGCNPSMITSSGRYLEDPDHVIEFKKKKIRLA